MFKCFRELFRLSGFPSGSSDEFEFDSVDFRLSLKFILFNIVNFHRNILNSKFVNLNKITQCFSPVDHNPGPLPKLHQLSFKLFSLQKIFFLHSPVDDNAGPLPALGVHLERVLDVVVRVAVVPHHVRLQLVLQEKC